MIASLYFGKHNTLLAVLEKKTNGYDLQYIKKLADIFDLNALNSNSSAAAMNEITEILSQFNITEFFVTLNPDNYISTNIPGSFKEDKTEFLKLVDFSIKQHFSDKSIDDFRIKAVPINFANKMEFVTMISNELIIGIESVVAMFGYELTDINPAHISAINSYNYNYIDCISDTAILIQLLDNIFEFILISNNKIIGLEYCSFEEDASANIIEDKLKQIGNDYSININSIYFYGDKLNKNNYLEYWKRGMLVGDNTKRLNPFRLFNANLEQRDKDYCMRMFQMYVACIGGALPTTQSSTTIVL